MMQLGYLTPKQTRYHKSFLRFKKMVEKVQWVSESKKMCVVNPLYLTTFWTPKDQEARCRKQRKSDLLLAENQNSGLIVILHAHDCSSLFYTVKLTMIWFSDNSRAGFEKRQKRRQIRALQEAIDKHDTASVKDILQDEFDVDFQYRSQTALQLAVREGCYDICKLLIEKGASVNTSDAENNNLLNMACWRGRCSIFKYCLMWL